MSPGPALALASTLTALGLHHPITRLNHSLCVSLCFLEDPVKAVGVFHVHLSRVCNDQHRCGKQTLSESIIPSPERILTVTPEMSVLLFSPSHESHDKETQAQRGKAIG